MHSLPTMVRSFSRHHRKRSQSDSLLVDGRQLSDGAMAGLVGEHASMVRMSAAKAAGSQAVEKSNQSATAALTSINVVASAGVEASFRSMPNLERVSRMVGHSHGSIHGPSHLAPHAQHQPQPQHLLQHLQRQSGGPEAAHTAGNVAGSAGSQQAPRRSDLQSRLATGAAAAVTDHSPLRPASRLSRSVVAGFQGGGGTSIDGDEDLTPAAGGCPLPPGQQQPARPHLARQLGLLPLTRGSAHGGEGQGGDAGASEAAALRQLRFSLASRQHSGVSSSLAAARQSYAFRVRDCGVALATQTAAGLAAALLAFTLYSFIGTYVCMLVRAGKAVNFVPYAPKSCPAAACTAPSAWRAGARRLAPGVSGLTPLSKGRRRQDRAAAAAAAGPGADAGAAAGAASPHQHRAGEFAGRPRERQSCAACEASGDVQRSRLTGRNPCSLP